MTEIKIDSIVCFTSDDEVFIEPLIKTLSKVSKNILFLYSDYFLGGDLQNQEILNKILSLKDKYDGIEFLKYEIDFSMHEKDNINGPNGISWKRYWISIGRKKGMEYLKRTKNSDWILILDSDEFPEPELFNEWKYENFNLLNNNLQNQGLLAINFYNYVYYWKPTYQALEYENSIIMVKPELLESKYEDILINEWDRTAYLFFLPDDKIKIGVLNKDNLPLFHHYSWVRQPDLMLNKIKNWGHSDDHLSIEITYECPGDDTIKYTMNKVTFHYSVSNYIGYKIFKPEKSEKFYEYYMMAINKEFCKFKILNNEQDNPLLNEFKRFMLTPSIENTEKLLICNRKLKLSENKFNIDINMN